jgi:hypothetical protein
MADKKNKSKIKSKDNDPFFDRNEFKEGFYNQPSQRPITAETMFGKGTTRSLEYPTVDPDTRMMQEDQLSTYTSGRSPEQYRAFKENPLERRDYKNGGDVHVEKGHSYIKDLIK